MKRTILFSGMMAGDPNQGGATWAILQYLLGFARLGHDVVFVEPIAQKSEAEYPPAERAPGIRPYFEEVVSRFGLEGRTALLLPGETIGLTRRELEAFAARADVLFNVSGMLTDETLLNSIATRVYLDLDPAFIQCWQSVYNIDMRLGAHTHFVSVGRNIGTPQCDIPTCGVRWQHTWSPVVLQHWPRGEAIEHNALTTIANWRGYGSVEWNGLQLGQKAHSLRAFFDLPSRTREHFAPALNIHPDETEDLAALDRNGWQRLDANHVAASPDAYRAFVRGSKGEWGIAKSGYVLSNCGWFSDRSASYLAAGRPVIAQETGWSAHLPTGRGLWAFQNENDVLAAIAEMNENYELHSDAARALAETYFDSDKVLTRLLAIVGL